MRATTTALQQQRHNNSATAQRPHHHHNNTRRYVLPVDPSSADRSRWGDTEHTMAYNKYSTGGPSTIKARAENEPDKEQKMSEMKNRK